MPLLFFCARPLRRDRARASLLFLERILKFSIKSFDLPRALLVAKTGCIAVGVYEQQKLSASAAALDVDGALTAALASGDISGKAGTTLLLRGVAGIAAPRVLLVGLGEEGSVTAASFDKAAKAALASLGTLGCPDAVIALPCDAVVRRDTAWAIARVVSLARRASEPRDAQKSKKDPAPTGVCEVAIRALNIKANRAALANALAIADGVELARTLADLAPNVCTPTYLAGTAVRLGQEHGFAVEVLDRAQIEALNMASFLAVAKGSDEPPKFIVMQHMGGKAGVPPVVLVGKGITFDSGGISLKPGAGMEEMKYDMGGAAAVLGVFRALGELQLKQNVIGVIATCENMPSGRAAKPGDIVKSMNGLTIEILNTDAEGRLVLCDALTYVERFAPAAVVNIATLTGACVVALGHHNTGLFTRDDPAHDALADELLQAGREANDTAWRLPIEEAYNEQLKSNFADLANLGTPGGGASVAAAFLENFTKKYTWAHLDNAGTAWNAGGEKGGSGRPVPLLVQYLLNRQP
jgi:leucyl aminopeptidase